MIRVLFAVFLVLHGLVHLLYFGHSFRFFELQPGLTWPDGAWAFSKILGNKSTRSLAGILLILIALIFAAGGIGLLAKQDWWRPLAAGAAASSGLLYLLLWDGSFQKLADKGLAGILINLAILAAVLTFKWPGVE
jgi:hypothetical protein